VIKQFALPTADNTAWVIPFPHWSIPACGVWQAFQIAISPCGPINCRKRYNTRPKLFMAG